MDQIMVKSEMNGNEEILLFYVDENGGNEEGVVTTIESMEQMDQEIDATQQIYIEDSTAETNEQELLDQEPENDQTGQWTVYETKRLLIFFIDNKETFVSGTTKKQFLWSIACKTMLVGKNPNQCEAKMTSLKRRYAQFVMDQGKTTGIEWQFLDLAHQAFNDDSYVQDVMNEIAELERASLQAATVPVITKKVATSRTVTDEKVLTMLNLYLKHKNSLKGVQKDYWQKGLWDTIALEMGEDDAEYWHKRFLNFKHNYIRYLERRKETGPEGINWPYMQLFDRIYEQDDEFQKKYNPTTLAAASVSVTNDAAPIVNPNNVWNDTELTVLVKYCFDCFDEFQDSTIPNNFLWNEVGRLLEKTPDICKLKYEQLKKTHLEKYEAGGYNLASRKPIDILFDSIISKTVDLEISKILSGKKVDTSGAWKTGDIDQFVQLFLENMELFKDPICYYVCWAAAAKKLKKTIQSCRKQWLELLTLYKSILSDKKDNPDMQIDWRYIDVFDRLFDYGMDEKLLEGYENIKAREKKGQKDTGLIGVRKINIKLEKNDEEPAQDVEMNGVEDSDDIEIPTHVVSKDGDQKAFKLLEFYQKNKDKFTTSRKLAIWEVLGKQIGMTGDQCAHRFRNLKQVYTGLVQREISKPEMPIVWPYYQLCKKVFGYRALKNKLKNNKADSDEEDWAPKEIKQIITYFAQNYHQINENPTMRSVWSGVSSKIGKSETSCRDKFMELRKSYRKIKTMKLKKSSVKVTWKYFTLLDDIFTSHENGQEAMDLTEYEEVPVDADITQEIQEDDDIQCIIVIPEGQDVSDLNNVIPEGQDVSDINNSQIAPISTQENGVTENTSNQPIDSKKWTKRTKKRLLVLYLNYLRSHKGQEINLTEMWKEISSKLPNKTSLSCRKMLAKLKKARLEANDGDTKKNTPYYALLGKIIALKPKFKKSPKNTATNGEKVDKDVPMETEKVQQALQFYLQNIEEFVSPRFEKKYAWSNLAKAVEEPFNTVFNKINYLKNSFANNTENSANMAPFLDILKQISDRELNIKANASGQLKVANDEEEVVSWSDDQTEQLLIWYLANLDKFKNPKFVRKYLWIESSNILGKSPLACSKKMSEVRTQYRNMVKDSPDALNNWRFYELCQKIYGTGKPKEVGQYS